MESVETLEKTTFSGRRFTRKQLAQVQETVQTFPNLSRRELAQTICEHLNWKTPRGANKTTSGLVLLEELESRGILTLPAKRHTQWPLPHPIPLKEAEAPIHGNLAALGAISLQMVTTGEDRALWKSYVQTYHYLGYKRPVGAHLCYFVVSEALEQKLGCLLFSASASWALAPRDKWIGWDKQHREKLLHLVLCQNRYLIFPWVEVSNLSSRILSLATKQVGDDWVRIHGYRPVLIETFVDTGKYSAASYRAANWYHLGETQGRGHDPTHEQKKSRKSIFVHPLQSDWRRCLTHGHRAIELKKRYRNDLQSSRTRSVGDAFVSMWKEVVDVIHEVAAQYDEKWRIRKRVIDSLILVLLIFRLVTSKNTQSYGTTIDDLWDSCDKLELPLPQPNSVAPSSFCAARKKLDEEIFKCINRRILEAYAPEAIKRTWLGHRLFAVDGSKVNLPRELIAYGYTTPSDNAHYPQGLVSCLYEVKTQLPYDFDLVSHADERKCAKQHLETLKKNDVVVYDRGYFSYVMLHQHSTAGIHAIFRLQENSCCVIREFFSSSQTDTLVTIYPSERAQKDIRRGHPELDIIPLPLRLLKYEVAGSMFCLGTTLTQDSHRYALQEFKHVYHSRWGVEELYKISKRIFIVEDFHGRTERGIKQEVFAHFALITMNRLFANRADSELNSTQTSDLSKQNSKGFTAGNSAMRRIKTNFKNCIHAVARNIEQLLLLGERVKAAVQSTFNAVIGQWQRARPGRSYVRKSRRPVTKWSPSDKKKTKSKQRSVASGAVPVPV